MKRFTCALVLGLLAAAGPTAAQESPTGGDIALQVTLGKASLNEGRKLMQAGRLAEAKDKLENSVRCDPTPEALIELGSCQEALVLTATAWGTFHRAEERARELRDLPRAEQAARRAAALEPRIPKLKVTLKPGDPTPRVYLDTRYELRQSSWGVPLPLDPGRHVVTAEAPGTIEFWSQVELGPNGRTEEVVVSMITLRPVTVPPASPPPPPPSPPWPMHEKVGLTLVITGGVGILTAITIGCLGIGCTRYKEVSLSRGVVIFAVVDAVVSPALVALGFYVMLYYNPVTITARAPRPFTVVPFVTGNSGGLSLQGTF